MIYSEKVMEYFMNPKNSGCIENPDGEAQCASSSCGDTAKIMFNAKNGVITDAKFETYGCACAVAASSEVCEMIHGKSIEYAENITNDKIIEELGGLPKERYKCSALAEKALKAAIENYKKRQKGILLHYSDEEENIL